MNRGLAADPLKRPRPLRTAAFNGLREELRGQWPASPRVERVHPGNAECAPEVTTRKVKQVAGDELPFLAVFDAMLVHPSNGPRPTRPTLTGCAVDPALMLA